MVFVSWRIISRQLLQIGNRIEATAVKRVAFYKSSQRKITPPNHTVPVYGFSCILGAGWMKSAILAQQRTQHQLIELNKA
jgi:hypothetical protein